MERFGREASARAHKLLDGQTMFLEEDPSQDSIDRYGRALRYLWMADGRLFNLEMVAQGYAFEYTYDLPYKYQAQFKQAAQRRLALLIQLQDARTRRLSDVTDCLAGAGFRTTAVPDDIAILRSHQAALEQIIVLIQRQRADTQTLLANLAHSHLPRRRPVSRFHRFLASCWGR